MVEGGTPNTLLRRGITRDSLKVGTELVDRRLPGARPFAEARQRPQRDLPDGRKLFLGSSGTGAPTDGADPADAAKPPTGRGRGGRYLIRIADRGVRNAD